MAITHHSMRPETEEEFNKMLADGVPLQKHCIYCKLNFSTKNVQTRLGWRETQISGFCETCWNDIFSEPSKIDASSEHIPSKDDE